MAEVINLEDHKRSERADAVDITVWIDPDSELFDVAYDLPEGVDHMKLANSLHTLAQHLYNQVLN